MHTNKVKLAALSLTLLFGSASRISAQTATTEGQAGTQSVFQSNIFGVGLSASLCSGMGISFRQHFAGVPVGYQITGGIWKTHNLFMYDIGAEVQYDLSLSANRLYAVAGAGYYYYGNTDVNGINTNGLSSPVRFGAGIGYEIPFNANIGVSLNLMVTVFEPDGDVLPLPSLGFHVYFK
ncbi:MAG TPA: hypothetical protein VG537_00285 [Candidatus Kapabacteria bacterium]|jgi:hypothetical protein|nr:hypothetical protein [Candidatus Kapabacteria bacterium]